jgi:toxin ParE1/3/4
MLPYVFHPQAAAELEDAVAHYESLAPGKGLELATQVQAAIEHICQFPESAPVTRGMVRSTGVLPSSRWRYTIHYRITPTGIRILAVAHHRRQPFYWFARR